MIVLRFGALRRAGFRFAAFAGLRAFFMASSYRRRTSALRLRDPTNEIRDGGEERFIAEGCRQPQHDVVVIEVRIVPLVDLR